MKRNWLWPHAAAAAKSLQSCPTLCDPIDGSPLGCPIPGILQARTLEWVAISFSSAWKWIWSHSVVSNSSQLNGLQPTRLLHPWDFLGKNTGVGCHCRLQGVSLLFINSHFLFLHSDFFPRTLGLFSMLQKSIQSFTCLFRSTQHWFLHYIAQFWL